MHSIFKAERGKSRDELINRICAVINHYKERDPEGREVVKTAFLSVILGYLKSERWHQASANECREIDKIIIPIDGKTIDFGAERFTQHEIKDALQGKRCLGIYKDFRNLCFKIQADRSQDSMPSRGGGRP